MRSALLLMFCFWVPSIIYAAVVIGWLNLANCPRGGGGGRGRGRGPPAHAPAHGARVAPTASAV